MTWVKNDYNKEDYQRGGKAGEESIPGIHRD